MTLWWIGNAIFLLVVIPVVVVILGQTLAPIKQIGVYAKDITKYGGQFGPHLEALGELGTTHELVRKINVEVERYIRAVDRIG